jgi:hypothetical protein
MPGPLRRRAAAFASTRRTPQRQRYPGPISLFVIARRAGCVGRYLTGFTLTVYVIWTRRLRRNGWDLPAFTAVAFADFASLIGHQDIWASDYGSATSSIKAPSPINYLAVRLKAGERWRYQPPRGHTVLWTAVGKGSILVPDKLQQGELVAFTSSSGAIEFEAQSDAEFVLGSAVPHKYHLVLGSHSVHTSVEAHREAETRISRSIHASSIREGFEQEIGRPAKGLRNGSIDWCLEGADQSRGRPSTDHQERTPASWERPDDLSTGAFVASNLSPRLSSRAVNMESAGKPAAALILGIGASTSRPHLSSLTD